MISKLLSSFYYQFYVQKILQYVIEFPIVNTLNLTLFFFELEEEAIVSQLLFYSIRID